MQILWAPFSKEHDSVVCLPIWSQTNFGNFFGCNPFKFCFSLFQGGDLCCIHRITCLVADELWKYFGYTTCNFCGPRFPRGWFLWCRGKHDLIRYLLAWFLEFQKLLTCNPCKFCGSHFPRRWFVWYIWKYDLINCLPVWSQTNFGIFSVVTHANFVLLIF